MRTQILKPKLCKYALFNFTQKITLIHSLNYKTLNNKNKYFINNSFHVTLSSQTSVFQSNSLK